MRRSIASSERPRYLSGNGWRSEMWSFSYAVRTGRSIPFTSGESRTLRSKTRCPLNTPASGCRLCRLILVLGSLITLFTLFTLFASARKPPGPDGGSPSDRISGGRHAPVQRIPLHRLAARRRNEPFDLSCRHRLGRPRPCHVVNLL